MALAEMGFFFECVIALLWNCLDETSYHCNSATYLQRSVVAVFHGPTEGGGGGNSAGSFEIQA